MNHEETIIFIGPSLETSVAAAQLKANYRPPVRRGDLSRLLKSRLTVRQVAIIDGEFGQSLAVSVTEIRALLQAGVQVFGASSMGALRAAECKVLGMIGIGWIYESYLQGLLQADDEVALLFDPLSSYAVTVPLVNVRWSLELAVKAGAVDVVARDQLLAIAKNISFRERTYNALIAAASQRRLRCEAENLADFVAVRPLECDRKRLDALMLLDVLKKEYYYVHN
jgi:hypothetical protein